MGWVNVVIAAASRQSVTAGTLLAEAGIGSDALAMERWPVDHITRLWHAAERCTGDPAFGLKAGAGIRVGSISAVSFVLQSAASLRDAIGLVQKYQRLISDAGRFQLLPGPATTWVVYHPCQGQLAFSPHQIEAVLAAVVTLARWLTATPLPPCRVQFSHERIGPLPGYQGVFGCPVDFAQAFSGLLVDNALLDRPLPQADARLAQVHEQYTAARLAALALQGLQAHELRQWLASMPGTRPLRRRDAARVLGVSGRTLARRLAEQGHTFEGLLDDVRRERALAAVAAPEMTLGEVARALGFAEPSTFYRAFRRWIGETPAAFRVRALAAPQVLTQQGNPAAGQHPARAGE